MYRVSNIIWLLFSNKFIWMVSKGYNVLEGSLCKRFSAFSSLTPLIIMYCIYIDKLGLYDYKIYPSTIATSMLASLFQLTQACTYIRIYTLTYEKKENEKEPLNEKSDGISQKPRGAWKIKTRKLVFMLKLSNAKYS